MVGVLQGAEVAASNASVGTAVDRLMMKRVDGCATLSARADVLRRISAEAEAEMERYFSKRWLALLTADAVSSLSFDHIVSQFPYHEGYRELVAAEARLLASPERIVFGGGGPLPISGVLLASMTGAEIVLVDADAEASEHASRLIEALETCGFIRQRQLSVLHENLAEISLDKPCSAIIVASLVDPEAKIRLAERLTKRVADRSAVPLLILRSAIGMCARLAYRRAPREAVVASGLKYIGEVVPANHVLANVDLDPATAKRFDVRSSQARDLLGIVSASVLNSVEVFGARSGATSQSSAFGAVPR